MHYVIFTTLGSADTTRASLHYMFASSAIESGDSDMIMLFHDSVMAAAEGSHEMMVQVGLPARFAEVFSHKDAEVLVCKPCAHARGITEDMLTANCRFGGIRDFHAHVCLDDSKAVTFWMADSRR